MTTMITKIVTLLRGTYVGVDSCGNCYYESRHGVDSSGRRKRWVVYDGAGEDASAVDPAWHGWLHHMTDALPDMFSYKWQRSARENKTGTPQAYFPEGDLRKGGKKIPLTGDYQPWMPD